MKEDRFLTIKEVAEITRVKTGTVYGWVREGSLKAYRRETGFNQKKRRLLFKSSDVETLIKPF